LLTTITAFPVSIPNVQPTSRTAGPDGNLWFYEAKINPSTNRVNLSST